MRIAENAAVKIDAEGHFSVSFFANFANMRRHKVPRLLNAFKLEFILNVQTKVAVFDH